ncbi:hypothetical protein TVAG_423690 [Trichomonas vaginalis G3]|uniref:Uncharacterized protein n=1 Tax=Trichomonas vaginalis (strain ATCC PRA-98 / G3) TaxID=412133 RepID=A2DTK7_TRIV3|nr:nucleotide-diphospho-sugar transferases family [Trichomonas vaginalis G3]EAY16316.1 hypothetical protein TVAG_423690 [Trichomonas vaginalis G3]KAI5523476.1 nucleotide-diphospho-sugar transferases family [Trichomonas vaginalis G3]|eukprot:XP_001328539.1 hypothetical protein [Trichomonas vaginalis G3]
MLKNFKIVRTIKVCSILFSFILAITCLIIKINSKRASQSTKIEKNLPAPCNFEPINEPCSTKRDVVFFYGTNTHKGLLLAVKSLRTTRAKCRIVVLVPSTFKADDEFANFAQEYDIEIYSGCDMKRKGDTIAHMLRYEYEAKWIEEHINEIDRVIHSDGYDVFFQSDPFVVLQDSQNLIFIVESLKILQCEWNANWVIDCYNQSIFNLIKDNQIICSGVILGPAIQYLRFVKLMIDLPEWSFCWADSYDQPIVNYLVHGGVLKDKGISYALISCDSNVLNMQWCLYGKSVPYSKSGFVMTPNNRIEPAILHQYNRFPDTMKDLGRQCGIQFS